MMIIVVLLLIQVPNFSSALGIVVPGEPSVDEEKVQKLLNEEKYEELISYTDEILDFNPDDLDALFYKGLTLDDLVNMKKL